MSKKGKIRKNDQHETGPDRPSDSSDASLPDDVCDEADPSNRAILAAIANLRNEVAQIKNEICASIEARIQTVCTELREELSTTTKEFLPLQHLRESRLHNWRLLKSWKKHIAPLRQHLCSSTPGNATEL